MDNMNDILSSVLGDPESMQQIKELADMLKSEMGENAPPQEDSSGSGLDPAALMKLMSAVTSADSDGNSRALLLALRPYLSSERREKVDKAVKLLRLYAVFISLRDSGALNDIGNFL